MPPLAIGLLQEAKHAVMRAGKGDVKRAAVDLFKARPNELQSCPALHRLLVTSVGFYHPLTLAQAGKHDSVSCSTHVSTT